MQKSTTGDVLAIDQGTHCGVVRGDGTGLPVVKTWDLPSERELLGEMLFDLRVRLIKEIKAGPLTAIVFETPLLDLRKPNLVTWRKLYAIAGTIETICYEFNVPCMEMDAGTWKRSFCGTGRVSKKDKPYPPMVRCQDLGIKVNNMDEADAVGIWATWHGSKGVAWLAGDLFRSLL